MATEEEKNKDLVIRDKPLNKKDQGPKLSCQHVHEQIFMSNKIEMPQRLHISVLLMSQLVVSTTLNKTKFVIFLVEKKRVLEHMNLGFIWRRSNG